MSRRQIKACFCPRCKRKLFRRKIKRNKPTFCNYCGHKISNPREIFVSKQKYLDMKNEEN